MKVEEIIFQVRNIINELATEGDSFSGETDNSIQEFIKTAARQIASLPKYMADPTTMEGENAENFITRPDGLHYLRLKMPEECLRPVSLDVIGWDTPVYVFHPVTDKRFLAQYSAAPGIGNGPASPIAFTTNDNGAYIIAHAVNDKAKYSLKYIAAPQINGDGTIAMSDKYADILAYTTAGLYLQSTDDFSKAKAAFDTAGSLIQNLGDAPSES